MCVCVSFLDCLSDHTTLPNVAAPIKTSIKAAYLAAEAWAVITQCTFMLLPFASWPLVSPQKNSFSCQWNSGHCYLIKIHPNMVRMDLLQHCAIEAVLYNKPSLSLLSLLLSPHVTMCLWLTLGLIHCDLLFVKTSYKRATPRSRVCIVGHPQYTILFLWQMWSWQSRIRQLP